MSTSSGPGTGSSTSAHRSTSGPPGWVITTACMAASSRGNPRGKGLSTGSSARDRPIPGHGTHCCRIRLVWPPTAYPVPGEDEGGRFMTPDEHDNPAAAERPAELADGAGPLPPVAPEDSQSDEYATAGTNPFSPASSAHPRGSGTFRRLTPREFPRDEAPPGLPVMEQLPDPNALPDPGYPVMAGHQAFPSAASAFPDLSAASYADAGAPYAEPEPPYPGPDSPYQAPRAPGQAPPL